MQLQEGGIGGPHPGASGRRSAGFERPVARWAGKFHLPPVKFSPRASSPASLEMRGLVLPSGNWWHPLLAAKMPPGRGKVGVKNPKRTQLSEPPPLHPYEQKRLMQCMQNNARLEELEIYALSRELEEPSSISHKKNKPSHKNTENYKMTLMMIMLRTPNNVTLQLPTSLLVQSNFALSEFL
ncbi:hypothetical protein PAHAL_9G326600 [Panicum hallii]|uniref:Uncharacterized protein n=1 Tax=Panicum hallii TaxID=206008 RepID=A0A2T8I370_9POAL|nr:hypothetical protein PAHAL_9G326600 [Panicum hallii]